MIEFLNNLLKLVGDVVGATHHGQPRMDALELGRERLDEAGEQAAVF